jgi:septum formation protein
MMLVLASRSAARMRLLADAGVVFRAEAADIDERAVEAPLAAAGASPAEVALHLAAAKALVVAARHPGAMVVGADQTLDLDGERFDKPADVAAAAAQLRRLRGRTHALHSAVACVRDGGVEWRHVETARLSMRAFTDAFLEGYLAATGEAVTGTVGAYQLEGRGAQLFDRVEGDHFTVLGLPLLPLFGFLRSAGVLQA